MRIELQNVTFGFSTVPLFNRFNAVFADKQITCILGKSGVGKTSLLSLISGMLKPTAGSIVRSVPDGRFSYAYQDLRLLPHVSAADNIRYVLPASLDRKEGAAIAARYLQALGLHGFETFLPAALSGGMQRRVSLARALAFPSNMLLLDEAFDSLDEKTRTDVVDLFMRIVQEEKRSVICVTHDRSLAKKIADSIIEL